MVRYHLINALLLNELKKQRRTIEEQEAEMKELKLRLVKLESRSLAELLPHGYPVDSEGPNP